MSTIDVRGELENVSEIRFADKDSYDYCPDVIRGGGARQTTLVETDSDRELVIRNKEHAENLIKALNKAIELGWLK
jgi:hypothetical protein